VACEGGEEPAVDRVRPPAGQEAEGGETEVVQVLSHRLQTDDADTDDPCPREPGAGEPGQRAIEHAHTDADLGELQPVPRRPREPVVGRKQLAPDAEDDERQANGDPQNAGHQRIEPRPPRLRGARGRGPGDQITALACPPCEPGHDCETHRNSDAHDVEELKRLLPARRVPRRVIEPLLVRPGRAGGGAETHDLCDERQPRGATAPSPAHLPFASDGHRSHACRVCGLTINDRADVP
jgi:hypothetical protein